MIKKIMVPFLVMIYGSMRCGLLGRKRFEYVDNQDMKYQHIRLINRGLYDEVYYEMRHSKPLKYDMLYINIDRFTIWSGKMSIRPMEVYHNGKKVE